MKHLAILLLALPAAAIAAVSQEMRVELLESKMNEITTRTIHDSIGGKTASASPQIRGEDWFLTADLLWWHLSEGGTDYAQAWEDPPLKGSSSVENRRLDFKWDYGFRAGIGKIFAHDAWDLLLNFTWFEAENSSVSSLHGGEFLVPLMQAPLPLKASQVKARWHFHFYTLDLNLGRAYFLSPSLSFHPFAGVKTAWISQSARSDSTLFSPVHATLHSKDRNDFWGIGPSLGTTGKWFLDYGFHLFGTAAGAILWGDFDVHHKEQGQSPKLPHNRIDLDLHQISPMTQLQIGIGYETNLYHDSYHIALSVAYEIQYFWNQNQMPQWTHFQIGRFHRQEEDLSLQGITTHLRFDF